MPFRPILLLSVTSLILCGCTETASRSSDGPNAWQRYALSQQAREAGPAAAPRTRTAAAPDCSPPGSTRAGSAPDARCAPTTARIGRGDGSRTAVAGEAALTATTRSLNPAATVIGESGPVPVPTPPAGGATEVSSTFAPMTPTPNVVAQLPPTTVPLASNQLQATPTPRVVFAPAPSTPKAQGASVPTAVRPSTTIQTILNGVRR